MSAMNDAYRDGELNFGRLLVLEKNAKNKITTIKQSLRSKYAKKVSSRGSREDITSHLVNLVSDGFRITGKRLGGRCEIYQVDNVAVSSFGILKLDGFVAGIEIDALGFKKLHNAVACYVRTQKIITILDDATNCHRDLLYALGENEWGNLINAHTKALDNLEDHYGRDLQAQAVTEINEVLTSSW